MKFSSKLLFIFTLVFGVYPTFCANERCSDAYLTSIGAIITDVEDLPKMLLFKTSYSMTKTGKQLLLKPACTSNDYLRKILEIFETEGLRTDEPECARCFGDMTKCIVKFCKGPCRNSPCDDGCINCVKNRCESKLLECTGLRAYPNVCKWKKEYLGWMKTKTG